MTMTAITAPSRPLSEVEWQLISTCIWLAPEDTTLVSQDNDVQLWIGDYFIADEETDDLSLGVYHYPKDSKNPPRLIARFTSPSDAIGCANAKGGRKYYSTPSWSSSKDKKKNGSDAKGPSASSSMYGAGPWG